MFSLRFLFIMPYVEKNFYKNVTLKSHFRQLKKIKVAQTLDFIRGYATFYFLKNVVRKYYFKIFLIFLFNSFGW